ncbi:ATP-binding protein [Nocardioides sp. NBC_00163]|uniref:AAA family ATPase n=1 Tax=Nocardioides sp. NBC_00163 TaxID=2975999 RepID=UPI003243A050
MKNLAEVVGARAEADPTLADDVTLVVWAALEGETALASLDSYEAPTVETPEIDLEPVEPAGAFLRRISVQGFRGIGAETSLELKPGPGLTVVAGRNGSGKSSLAEALELAVTGQTYRFEKKSVQWKDVWRNLHAGDLTRISVDLAEEGEHSTRIELGWEPDADLTDVQATVQRHGKPRQDGLEALGWTGPAQTFRPVLTYDELGSLLTSERSKLYDALATVLGTEELTDAIKRLETYHKSVATPVNRAKAMKTEVLELIGESDDERAEQALKLVKSAKPDIHALRALATGVGSDDASELSAPLPAILGLSLPGEQIIGQVRDDLDAAVAALAVAGDQALEPLERRVDVAAAALSIHSHDGDQVCPVCGDGMLDAARVEELRAETDRARTALSGLRAAREDLSTAAAAARSLVAAPPAMLAEDLPGDLDQQRRRTLAAWRSWAAAPAEPTALAGHLDLTFAGVAEELTNLQKAVAPVLAERDDAWSRLATRVAAYADEAEAAEQAKPRVDVAKKALRWLKDNDTSIKNELLAPIAERAKEIWADLRQESNVEISDLELKGANTHRRVEITSAVDGADAGGMAVLSQGELHALALALFLPRASLPDSPFRFVVLDDPVQAMDPAKVDGLLKALTELAQTRQVVVFSHDDRLAAAVRRAGFDATLIQVSRGAESVVTIHSALDPAKRYLDDAEAMAKDGKLPDATKRRLLPGMLRMAVEAAAHDRYFAMALGNGATLTDVENCWSDAKKTSQKVGLALHGASGKDLSPWLARGYRSVGLGITSSGFHKGLTNKNPVDAWKDVRDLVDDIRAGAK